jgi:MFS family permease
MLALIATLAVQALVSMAVLTPPVFAPVAAPEMGLSASQIGIYTSIVYAAACVASLASGRLIAAQGPMRLSQWCLAVCGIGLALIGSASVALVVAGAALIGLGYGPITPSSSQILMRTTPPHRRALVFSLKQTGVPIGGILAGTAVPILIVAWGWRPAALAAALACVAVALAVQPLRAGLDAEHRDVPKQGSGIFDAVRLVLGIPAMRRLAGASFAFAAAQLCFGSFLVASLTHEAGRTIVEAGIVLAVAQVAGVGARILWGWIGDRFVAPRLLLGLLGLGMGVATALVGLFGPGWTMAAMIAVACIHGATAIGWNGVYIAEIARLAPPGLAGMATGGALFVTFMGIVLSPPLFTALVATSGTYRVPFWVIAGAAALGGLACLMPVREPAPRAAEASR